MTITLTREEAEAVLDALMHQMWSRRPLDATEVAMETLRARLAQPEQSVEPVAWRTFDGEGGYNYRDYELNEDYGYWWEERHPNHKGWVQPLYIDPTPCKTCEALARTVMMDQTSHDTAPPQREWQGLTEGEVVELALGAFALPEVSTEMRSHLQNELIKAMNEPDSRLMIFAATIEQALQEKNT